MELLNWKALKDFERFAAAPGSSILIKQFRMGCLNGSFNLICFPCADENATLSQMHSHFRNIQFPTPFIQQLLSLIAMVKVAIGVTVEYESNT